MPELTLEIFLENQWMSLGYIEIQESTKDQGTLGAGTFNYDLSYMDRYGAHLYETGIRAASLRYPLSWTSYQEKTWPAFLLDLIPTGAARNNWLRRLNIADGPQADFTLLEKGAINPPGNIRVKNDHNALWTGVYQMGFAYSEVVSRGQDFINYAEQMGAVVAGSSGAQGVSPKFLLVQDYDERWHADGAIADHSIAQNWLVKFPRSKNTKDLLILQSEAAYYEIARDVGLKTGRRLKWESNTLFIPRFDRISSPKETIRMGLESLYSALGIATFGQPLKHEDCLKIIRKFSTAHEEDLLEYVRRDFVNIVSGNPDNHGRNTAFIKTPDGQVRLTPLFDFAPMALDESGIPRATRWHHEVSMIPDFAAIADSLEKLDVPRSTVSDFFRETCGKLGNIPSLMKKHDVHDIVVRHCMSKYDEFINFLEGYVRTL